MHHACTFMCCACINVARRVKSHPTKFTLLRQGCSQDEMIEGRLGSMTTRAAQ